MWKSNTLASVMVVALVAIVSCKDSKRVDPASGSPVGRPARPTVALQPPSDDDIPGGVEGDAVRLGRELATRTFERLPDYVGSDLHCTSCHLDGGRAASAGPWVGVTSVYPEYRSRAGREITIEDRIDECFERSLNGKPLPRAGPEMRAFVAYMSWLSRGVPKGNEVTGRGFARLERPPNFDSTSGKTGYAVRCAMCHGSDGAGRRNPDGSYFAPPLWGPRSFNVAAGMARLDTAAAFVRHNMPLGQGNTLTIWETYDIAAYFIEQPRDDFEGKRLDWPRGGKPTDARY
jgi:thiosulfate dehydrogenase